MAPPSTHPTTPAILAFRRPVLRAAVVLAAENRIASLTMHKLGETLRVEAMSLYNDVTNKDDVVRAEGGIEPVRRVAY